MKDEVRAVRAISRAKGDMFGTKSDKEVFNKRAFHKALRRLAKAIANNW